MSRQLAQWQTGPLCMPAAADGQREELRALVTARSALRHGETPGRAHLEAQLAVGEVPNLQGSGAGQARPVGHAQGSAHTGAVAASAGALHARTLLPQAHGQRSAKAQGPRHLLLPALSDRAHATGPGGPRLALYSATCVSVPSSPISFFSFFSLHGRWQGVRRVGPRTAQPRGGAKAPVLPGFLSDTARRLPAY